MVNNVCFFVSDESCAVISKMSTLGEQHGMQADIMFVIEGTATNGAYLNDLKTNYLIPTLEYFSQGNIEDRDYVCEVS